MLELVRNVLLITGMLSTGTINTIAKKIQFGCSTPGYYNYSANGTTNSHIFNKPWFQTYLMFIGEILCLVGYLIFRCIKKKSYRSTEGEFLLDTWNESEFSKPLFSWIFILPAMCDIAGSTLQGIGLLYIDASVWQMLRGSIIVFAGLLSVIFLKRRLLCFQWTGMMITVLGLCLVGISSIFKPTGATVIASPWKSALGLFLVLAGSLATASQMIVEEVFLKRRRYHPLHVVGMEGFFGAVIMGFIILPIIHHSPGSDLNGSFENQLDAIFQTVNDPVLLFTSILLIFSIAFFNYFGLAVTNCMSAVHRTLLDALRSIFVWVSSLFLFYVVSHTFGEPFDSAWGLVEIDGFCLLVIGTFVFNKTLRLSCLPCCAESAETVAVTAGTDDTDLVIPEAETDECIEKRPLLDPTLSSNNGGTFSSDLVEPSSIPC